MDNNFYSFHDVFIKNNVDVNDINTILKLNVMHIATADPRTEIKRQKHIIEHIIRINYYYLFTK